MVFPSSAGLAEADAAGGETPGTSVVPHSMVRHVHFRRGEEKALAERSAIGMPIATPVIAKCIDLLHLCTVMLPEAGGRVPDATAGRIPPGIEVSPGR